MKMGKFPGSDGRYFQRNIVRVAESCAVGAFSGNQWLCRWNLEALSLYGLVAERWDLPLVTGLRLPVSETGFDVSQKRWHVSHLCPGALSKSVTIRYTTLEEVSRNMCAHCSVVTQHSSGVLSMFDATDTWEAGGVGAAMMAVLLFSLTQTTKIEKAPLERSALTGLVTGMTRTAAASGATNPNFGDIIPRVLGNTLQMRTSLLERRGVRNCDGFSLFARNNTLGGGLLQLSDSAYLIKDYVVLSNAHLDSYAASTLGAHIFSTPHTSESALGLQIELLDSGLTPVDAQAATNALCRNTLATNTKNC